MIEIKENISLRQSFIILYIILTSGVMSLGGSSDAGRDTWISPILGIIFAMLLYFVYYKPFILFEKEDFFEILDISYGKVSKIINIFLCANAFLLASVSIARFSIFLNIVSLNKTPLYIISLFMITVCIYGVYSGFEVLARFSEIFIGIIIFFLIFSVITSYSILNFKNIYPILENGIIPLLNGGYTILSTLFMETFFLIALFSQSKKRKDMPKILNICVIISAISMSIVFLRNLLILGYPAMNSLYYPSYTAISIITLGEFFQRQEVFVSFSFLIADILKICVYMIYICKSINHMALTKEYKAYSIAIGIFIYFISLIIFENAMELYNFLAIYRYILTIPCLIIPIITYILCVYKNNKRLQNKS